MKFELGKDDELRIEVDYKKATQIRVSSRRSLQGSEFVASLDS